MALTAHTPRPGDAKIERALRTRAMTVLVAAFLLVIVSASCSFDDSPVSRTQVTNGTGPGQHVVVALGDSVPAGAACSCKPFPDLYGSLLTQRTGASVEVTNEAVNGLDTRGLLAQLQRTHVATAVSRADVVLVTIGANDFGPRHDEVVEGACTVGSKIACVDAELNVMRDQLRRILSDIHSLREGRPTSILVTGYWNVFEDKLVAERAFGPEGLRASIQLTHLVNGAIRAVAAEAGASYVDLFAPFHMPELEEDTLLADDGDHPDAAGHALIAHTLLDAGLPKVN